MGGNVFKAIEASMVKDLLPMHNDKGDDKPKADESKDAKDKHDKEVADQLAKAFAEFDKNKDQKLDKAECGKAVNKFLDAMDNKIPDALEDMMDRAWKQVEAAHKAAKQDLKSDVKTAFKKLEKESLKKVQDELKALTKDSQKVSDEIFAKIDADSNSTVDLKEFTAGFTAQLQAKLAASVKKNYPADEFAKLIAIKAADTKAADAKPADAAAAKKA